MNFTVLRKCKMNSAFYRKITFPVCQTFRRHSEGAGALEKGVRCRPSSDEYIYMLFSLAKWLGNIHLTRGHGPSSDQSALIGAS